jgi:hypothetical protein
MSQVLMQDTTYSVAGVEPLASVRGVVKRTASGTLCGVRIKVRQGHDPEWQECFIDAKHLPALADFLYGLAAEGVRPVEDANVALLNAAGESVTLGYELKG